MLSTLPPDLQSFLFWLATTPGALFSQLDGWLPFQKLSPIVKWAIQIVFSGIAAALLTLLSSPLLTPAALGNLNAGYVLVVQIITAILANLGAHIGINKLIRPVGKSFAVRSGPLG